MIADSAVEFKVDGIRERLTNLEQWLAVAAQQGKGEHEVEGHLFREMLAMGKQLLGAFLKLAGPGDVGETVMLKEGHTVKRFPEQHARRLLTVFGEFSITRWVYGTRPGQKIELTPTDQRLQLPEGDVSYLLQEWDQLLGTEQAFGLVQDTLETILGIRQSVDTLERNNRQMAEAACRHVIKDRIERAGMRWKVPGAQAMLQLRAIHANGDWRAFQDARIKYDNARLYPDDQVLKHIPWSLAL